MFRRPLINVTPFGQVRVKRISYVQVKKSCSKKACRICRGILKLHGPYWYRVEWDPARQMKKITYVGRILPPLAARALRMKRLVTQPNIQNLISKFTVLRKELVRWRNAHAALRLECTQLQKQLMQMRAKLLVVIGQKDELTANRKEISSLQGQVRQLYQDLAGARAKFSAVASRAAFKSDKASKIYKKLAIKYHPDRSLRDAEIMKDLNKLWQSIKKG